MKCEHHYLEEKMISSSLEFDSDSISVVVKDVCQECNKIINKERIIFKRVD